MDRQELSHWWNVYIGDELQQQRRTMRYVRPATLSATFIGLQKVPQERQS